jgi:hypothetical protein
MQKTKQGNGYRFGNNKHSVTTIAPASMWREKYIHTFVLGAINILRREKNRQKKQ